MYWLLYLDTFKESRYRFRTARRLLLGSAEDGHSIAVMEKVVDNFRLISKPQTELHYLVAEAVRICKVPNWWHRYAENADIAPGGRHSSEEGLFTTGVDAGGGG